MLMYILYIASATRYRRSRPIAGADAGRSSRTGCFATPCQSGYFLNLSRLVLPSLTTFSRGFWTGDGEFSTQITNQVFQLTTLQPAYRLLE